LITYMTNKVGMYVCIIKAGWPSTVKKTIFFNVRLQVKE